MTTPPLVAAHTDTPVDVKAVEWQMCSLSPEYFIDTYCRIYDSISTEWVPFRMWDGQFMILDKIHTEKNVIVLKPRQIGISWLVLCYGLWLMLFRPIASILVFSRRDDEAVYLLSDERLRGIYERLPRWMKAAAVVKDGSHLFGLSNGSTIRAFSTSGGDSYTATLAIIDEADLIGHLPSLIRSVKPTVDAGGKLVLVSRVDKSKPNSMFKAIYRGARAGENAWKPIFVPWSVHPGRTEEWYQQQCLDAERNEGSLDSVYEQYPATEAEALAPRELDKRIPSVWIEQCFNEYDTLTPELHGFPSLPGLELFVRPVQGQRYVIGADPAEGLRTSDDSAAVVLDANFGEQVCSLVGKISPPQFAYYISLLSRIYNGAAIMVENNNHGWAVINWLEENTTAPLLRGHLNKLGWSTTASSKAILMTVMSEAFRHGETVLHSFETMLQIASLEQSTLSAPPGDNDDRAVSYALALAAMGAEYERVIFDDSVRVRIGW